MWREEGNIEQQTVNSKLYHKEHLEKLGGLKKELSACFMSTTRSAATLLELCEM